MTYYEGLNIGLNYDASTGTWGFTNQSQNFIDPNAFSTTDQEFVYAPPETVDPDTPEQDPCPPGYVYDTELKQCVPDPNFQAPDFLGQPSSADNDPNKDNPQTEFIDFDASSAEGRKFMYDHAMDKGYVNNKGQVLGPPKAPNIGFMTAVAQFGINRQYNRWLKELGQYDANMKSQGLKTGFVQVLGQAPVLLESFYDPQGSTKIRDVSTEPVTPIRDEQITETPAPDTSGSGDNGSTTSTQVSPSSGQSFYETTYGNVDDYQGFTDSSSNSSSGGTFSSPQQTQQSYSSMYKDTDKPEGDAGI